MAALDAESGGPSGVTQPSGPPQAAELALDAYGSDTRGLRIALHISDTLGILGFLLLVAGTGHGDALNDGS